MFKIPKTKIFEGKRYTLVAEDITKKGANRAAEDQRGLGKSARVVVLGKHEGRTFYGIYSYGRQTKF